jgi:hypothetical protein
VLLALAVAPAAHAAGWHQVTASDGANTDQVSLVRTGDGTLHVAWRHGAPNADSLMHTAVGLDGKVGATTPVQTGWADIQNPAIVSTPGGLRMFWGALRTTDPSDPNDEMSTALSADGGATWAGTLGTWVHAGLSPATPNHDLQAPLGQYGYLPGIAVDSGGRAVVAWYSSAAGHLGVYAQDVASDGSPIGSAINMPGTSDMQFGQTGRTPIAARPGGGLFVAYATGYPSLNRIRVWRVGAQKSTRVAKADGGASATVATDMNGRVWVVWEDDRGVHPAVYARRSNPAGTKWGATVVAGRPKGASSAYSVDASTIGAFALDVFGSFALDGGTPLATYTRRVLPGLTLLVTGTPRRGKTTKLTFTVLDAGAPVKGATVEAGGDSGTTSAAGKVVLTVHAARKLTARATAPGYTTAARKLKVRR